MTLSLIKSTAVSDEERWYAAYLHATSLADLGDDAAFVRACLECFERRPTRAEPLFALACHYRARGLFDACVMACEVGLRVGRPGDDELGVEAAVYDYGLREQIAISGFYCSDARMRDLGRALCLELAVDRSLPRWVRGQARENCVFYARSAAEMFGEVPVRPLELRVPEPYLPLNPSVWIDGDERRVFVRTVNYRTDPGDFVIHDPNWVIRTQNYDLHMSSDWRILDAPAVIDRSPGPPLHGYPVRGFEDGRIFKHRGRWWFIAAVRDRHPTGLCEIALCELRDGDVVSTRLLRGPWSNLHQKNWVPVVEGDRLRFVYGADPTVILECDVDSSELVELSSRPPGLALDHVRGGSQAVRTDQGWLYVAHEAVVFSDFNRVYLHRFVALDDDLRITGISDPFYFALRTIEFVAGLARDGDRLVASFGIDDRRACLAWLDEARVLASLRPVT